VKRVARRRTGAAKKLDFEAVEHRRHRPHDRHAALVRSPSVNEAMRAALSTLDFQNPARQLD